MIVRCLKSIGEQKMFLNSGADISCGGACKDGLRQIVTGKLLFKMFGVVSNDFDSSSIQRCCFKASMYQVLLFNDDIGFHVIHPRFQIIERKIMLKQRQLYSRDNLRRSNFFNF